MLYKAGLTLKSVDNIKKGNQSITINKSIKLLNSTFLGCGTCDHFSFLGGGGGGGGGEGGEGISELAINPLNPKSDQYQNSPSDINALQNRLLMRFEDMITKDKDTMS